MDENKLYEGDELQTLEEEENELGKVEISPEVIEVIASLAASEVQGVASMQGNFASGVVERISNKKSYGKGVKVDLGEDGIVIDVQLRVQYGVSIQEVGERVQENIAQTLRTMTALEVKAINIHVVGIQFQEETVDIEEDFED